MVQEIKRDGEIICTTKVPYSPHVIKDMQEAGYRIYQDGRLLPRRSRAPVTEGDDLHEA